MNIDKFQDSQFATGGALKEIHKTLNAARLDKDQPLDISLEDHLRVNHDGMTLEAFYEDLGIDPEVDTIQNLFTLPDSDDTTRWLIPEIWRSAIDLGLRTAPIWSNVTALEQSVSQTSIKMPYWEMSDAAPRYVGEAETIPLGNVAYGTKDVAIRKMGRGIKMSYEVAQYSSIALVNIFLRDFGIKLGHALDTLLIDVLINGEQADGSESAPVIGVTSATTLDYKSFLRLFIRMARIGRSPSTMIAGENMALDTLDLDEYKTRVSGTPQERLNIRTPLPNSVDFFIHGNVPANQVIVLDPGASVIKLNAQPLLIESDKIVSNQTLETYASLTTGFATLFRDARVIVDKSLNFSGAGFPSYMDPTTQENTPIQS